MDSEVEYETKNARKNARKNVRKNARKNARFKNETANLRGVGEFHHVFSNL